MSKINILGLTDKDDIFYRYKMEKMEVVKEKTKTAITNIEKVCSDLGVTTIMVIEFFKKKFNCGMIYKNNKLLISKNLSYLELYLALREFIEYFVICPVCTLPELDWEITSKCMKLNCRSCSFKSNRTTDNIGNKIAAKTLNILLKKF